MRILSALAVLAVPVLACECHRYTACELLQLPTLFVGEVIEGGVTIREDPYFSSARHVRFKVLENFRGLPSDTRMVDVEVDATAGMCAPNPFFAGGQYLVVPNRGDDGKLHGGGCSDRDVNEAPDDVRVVRDYFAGRMPVNVNGRVAVSRSQELVDFELSRGEAKPLSGVRVWTSRNGAILSTNTDAEGRYALTLPAGGMYEVHASLDPYVPRDPAARISVANKACSVHDFAMGIDTSISGHVFDNARPQQPLGSALVGLIDLNHPISEPDTHPWFNQEYTEHDFAYKFENVPIGRYLLVFNPDGPRTGGLYDLPLESNYYPASSTRSAAKVIEVTSAGVHLTGMDLVAGERVEFRQVVVGVRFSDGAPMKTAAIRCVALPLKEGEPSLVFKNFPLLEKDDGTVHILAPANRKLRIEVQDAYGRKLNGSYAATYEPGSTPITQEFVVTP